MTSHLKGLRITLGMLAALFDRNFSEGISVGNCWYQLQQNSAQSRYSARLDNSRIITIDKWTAWLHVLFEL